MTVDETEFLILECRIKIRLNCILWLGFIQVIICFFSAANRFFTFLFTNSDLYSRKATGS